MHNFSVDIGGSGGLKVFSRIIVLNLPRETDSSWSFTFKIRQILLFLEIYSIVKPFLTGKEPILFAHMKRY